MATSRRTGILASALARAVAMVTPLRRFWGWRLRRRMVQVDVAVKLAREAEGVRLAAGSASAACADSCMTSPSWPVMVSFPSSRTWTSVVRMLPPTSVHARPVTRPTSLFSCASESRNLGTPRNSPNPLGGQLFLVFGVAFDDLAGNLAGIATDRARGCARRLHASSADDFEDGVVFEDDVFLAQAGLLALFLDEILARDLQLLHSVCRRRISMRSCSAGMV